MAAAATKISSVYRGNKAREQVNEKKAAAGNADGDAKPDDAPKDEGAAAEDKPADGDQAEGGETSPKEDGN